MALSTKVNMLYRSPWIPDMAHPPEDEIKLMKYEIKRMREDLIKKQGRLKKHPEFSRNYSERAVKFLKNETSVKGLTNRQVQNLWSRLRTMELSNSFSVSGLKLREKHSIETLQAVWGFEDMSHEEFIKFGKFMQWARAEYEMENIDSSRVVEFYQEHMTFDMDDLRGAFNEWYDNQQMEEQNTDWDEGVEVNIKKLFKR